MKMPLLKELLLKYKELKKQIPRRQATGENISLNDSSDLGYEDFKINGKSEQETRDDKNKFKSLNPSSKSANITFNSNDLTIDFSNSVDTYFGIIFDRKINTTYTMVFDCSGISSSDNIRYTITGNQYAEYNLKNGKNIIKFTTNSSEGETATWDDITRQSTSKVTISNIMILEGEYTEDNVPDYQPYGAMPSPEFPSPIKSVADDINEFNPNEELSNGYKAFYAKESVANSDIGNNIFQHYAQNTRCKAYFRIKAGQTRFFKLFDENYKMLIARYANEEGIVEESLTFLNNNPMVCKYTATKDGYIYLSLIKVDGSAFTDEEAEKLKNCIKICEKEPMYYSEYGKGTVEIIQQGKNLYNVNDKMNFSNEVTVDEDDWITINYDNTNGEKIAYKYAYTNISKALKSSTEYLIIVEIKNVTGTGIIEIANGLAYDCQFNDSVLIRYNFSDLKSGQKIFVKGTTTDSFELCRTMLRTQGDYNIGTKGSITFRISVLKDTTVTEDTFVYQQYQGQNTVIQTAPLRSLPNGVCDIKDKDKTIRNIKSIVLNEKNINSSAHFTSNYYGHPAVYLEKKKLGWKESFSKNVCLINRYKEINNTKDVKSDVFTTTFAQAYLYIFDDRFTDLDTAKQLLLGTEIIIQLAEPVVEEEPCEELKNLHSYKNITNITTEGDIKPELDITYYRDLETMFKNLEK